MNEHSEILNKLKVEALAKDFRQAVDKGDYRSLLQIAKKAQARPEEVQKAFESSIAILETALRQNHAGGLSNLAIAGLGVSTFSGMLISFMACELIFDNRALSILTGIAGGIPATGLGNLAFRTLDEKIISARLMKLSRAYTWWAKQRDKQK